MKPSFREKLRYKFERFMAKGGASIFVSLVILFAVCFVFAIGIRWVIMAFAPDFDMSDGFSTHIWRTFLEMTDPGNMNQDNASPTVVKLSTIISGIIGVVIFSMLIAFITAFLEKTLYEFRKGAGKVLEFEQTLILGWNERVIDIILELIIANESEKKASIVILANHPKEDMDDTITKYITDPQTTSIITTSGNPTSLTELRRINAQEAKSVIVLASCSDSASNEAKILSDTQSIMVIMALVACQGGENELPIIAEVFNQDKRDIVASFEDENIISIDSWDIMGKLLVQTSLTSGLEMVYNEVLSFDGSEVYFYQPDNGWNNTNFYDLPFHFIDGIPLGIHKANGDLLLRPPTDTLMEDDDEILILAEDDSTIDFNKTRLFQVKDFKYEEKKLEPTSKRTLVLGWHDVAKIFIREADDYLLEGSSFDIMFHEPSDEIMEKIDALKAAHDDLVINHVNESPLHMDYLISMNPFTYDNIIILSQDSGEQSAEKVDSDTLMILLMLRKVAREKEITNHHTKIITQILNSENQDLIIQTDVDDFIISNKLITMILAQLSEAPEIKKLYDDIFEEDGSEIYVKPTSLYFTEFPVQLSFADVMATANKRDEICLGIRLGNKTKNPDENFGVILNLPKDKSITLNENDYLVVLAEDEL